MSKEDTWHRAHQDAEILPSGQCSSGGCHKEAFDENYGPGWRGKQKTSRGSRWNLGLKPSTPWLNAWSYLKLFFIETGWLKIVGKLDGKVTGVESMLNSSTSSSTIVVKSWSAVRVANEAWAAPRRIAHFMGSGKRRGSWHPSFYRSSLNLQPTMNSRSCFTQLS